MGTQSRGRSHRHQVTNSAACFINHPDHIQMHWWPFFKQRYAVYYYLVDGKKILKEGRFSTQCPNVPSCSLCPSKGKTAASGPSLGFVLLTYFTFLVRIRGCCLHNVSICVKLQWNVCHVGDGWSRGTSLSHAAAGVLGGGVKLVGGLAGRERQHPRPHHQTFQVLRLSGAVTATLWLVRRQILGFNEDKVAFPPPLRFLKVMWMIPETLTMLGWRRLPWTSTMNRVTIVYVDTHTCSQAIVSFIIS